VPSLVPTAALDEVFLLGEGPVWDAPRRRLLWVDILAGTVIEGRLDMDQGRVDVTARRRVDDLVGSVAVAADGTLAVAARDRILTVAPDGSVADGPVIVPAGQARRLNDGAPDPAGRLVVGTLSLDGPSTVEELVRVEPDGHLTRIDTDLTLSNGVAWSADGRTLFSADSRRRTVFARDYDPHGQAVGERRVFLTLQDALPDGIAVDEAGCLWVAAWGSGQLRRFLPDGSVAQVVTLPAPHVTNAAFAGDDLRTLVITTGSAELTDDERTAHPDSGRIFTLRVDVPGLPLPQWQPLSVAQQPPTGVNP
jgi:sugar lactone lactonase YvrE